MYWECQLRWKFFFSLCFCSMQNLSNKFHFTTSTIHLQVNQSQKNIITKAWEINKRRGFHFFFLRLKNHRCEMLTEELLDKWMIRFLKSFLIFFFFLKVDIWSDFYIFLNCEVVAYFFFMLEILFSSNL